MIDDTRDNTEAGYTGPLTDEVIQIAKHRAYRREVLWWAQSLRFLAFGDNVNHNR